MKQILFKNINTFSKRIVSNKMIGGALIMNNNNYNNNDNKNYYSTKISSPLSSLLLSSSSLYIQNNGGRKYYNHQLPRYCSSSSNNLSEVLSNELMAEKANDDTIDVELVDITEQIQKTFKINDQKGLGIVTLERKFKGETIEIVFDCQDEVDDDEDALGDYMEDVMNEDEEKKDDENDDEELEQFVGINFNIIISKGKEKMLINCIASKNLRIENAQFIPSGKEIDDDNLYSGPLFYQLDESLQEAFKSYLSDRKIDEDLCYFILAYSRNKEQKEYVNWLENMLDFTEQSPKKLPSKP